MNERLKWWGKQAGIGAGWMVVGALLTALTLFVALQSGGPDLGPWRTEPLDGEFTHRDADEIASLDRYLTLESRLFERLERRMAEEGRQTGPLGRFNPDSPTCPRRFEPDGNRTFQIAPPPEVEPRGAALLLHGLSDSPYSVRSVGELLAGEGFQAIGMRLPGHGTLPAALRDVSFKDWRAATRIGALEAAGRAAGSGKLILVGYSNGAALALDYTLNALDDPELPVPDTLIFLSPAFAVTRLAGLARFQRFMSELPGLDKLAYNSTLPEYDPYKYNSFPIQAAEQIYRLTNRLEQGLARLKDSGRIGELPPALTLQSAVDATVPPISSLTRLYGRLEEGGSQIVLFDVNRLAQIESLLAPHVDELFDEVRERRTRPFDITVVTNVRADSREVLARTWPAGSTTADEQILDMV